MIQCRDVTKSFGDKNVIRGVDITLLNGKITALIGKNGAGKSTLIAMMVGYYHLDSGNIQRKTVSIMPDADSMFLSWTGIEFLKFISKIKKVNLSEAMDLARELGIDKNLKEKIGSFSFGMRKKLSFIQCAIGQYDTYIFDEPTSGVDVPSALIMLKIITRLKLEGAAILLTSHNIDELERVSDYVYILENGKISQEGTVEAVTNQKKEVIYILSSSAATEISNDYLIQEYVKEIHENTIECLFVNEEMAIEILKKLVTNYPIVEFYQKKESLLDSIYASD